MTAMLLWKRRVVVPFLILCVVFLFFYLYPFASRFADSSSLANQHSHPPSQQPAFPTPSVDDGRFHWADVPQRYPVTSMIPIPSSLPGSIPAIQHHFPRESPDARRVRKARLDVIKGNFTHAWQGYKTHAWMSDEVAPLSGRAHNPFGGWAATLVDALDTLWIMELHDEFSEAVEAISKIDFSTCALEELNVFETTIRYLGGFLAAYDISERQYPILLQKAIEVGEMLYVAFDTPNRMPVTRWNFNAAINGVLQEASEGVLVAEIGSLTLEFTRLSQLSGNPRYFDAVQRIMNVFDIQQNQTKLPGMWPIVVNAKELNFADFSQFTIGGMADSLYEYLPKQYILLGGSSQQYRKLYHDAMAVIKNHIFYRPMTKGDEDVLLSGEISSDGQTPISQLRTEAKAQHLGCFAGGMVAIGAKIFDNAEELVIARKLVDGCLWGYETGNLGIMPEIMHTVACEDQSQCPWDQHRWHQEVDRAFPNDEMTAEEKIQKQHLPPGVSKIDDTRYILRPEAIESIFILYRITGDPSLPDRAWKMFNAIIQHTITDIAHAALDDCTVLNPPKADRMESFWMAETLKYFYLVFSEPDVVSLDKYVLNTEAHPLRRPL